MKKTRFTLKGKSIFIVALITIGLTFLTVYLTGINYNRALTTNLYISLGLIATFFFMFLTFSLYKGSKLIDNYPKFEKYNPGSILNGGSHFPAFDVSVGEGLEGLILTIVLWIAVGIGIIIFLIVFEAVFWLSLFVIFASLYWLFIRALKLVFNKAAQTKGDLPASVYNAFVYTTLYTGWLFIIAFVVDVFR